MIDRDTVNRWSQDAHRRMTAEGRDYNFTDVMLYVVKKTEEAEREACAFTAEMTPSQFGENKRVAEAIRARGAGGEG